MSTDARFDKIQKILPHDNADALEIAMVSGFPCVVRKGEFKAGDTVFYIRDDAKLTQAEAYLEWSRELREHPDAIGPLEFMWTFPWQESLVKYLGSGARVRTVKLRGKISMGILLRPETVCLSELTKFYLETEHFDELNLKITDPERGERFLAEHFGVGHWTAPVGNVGTLDVLHQGLDFGLAKSDEENWENLSTEDLHFGEKCIVTRKLDGTSCTVICQPNGEYSVASRGQTFDVKRMAENETENVYTMFTKEAVKAGLWYAKKYNRVIALRGEVCCNAVQNFSVNKDRKRNGFFIYGCEFPELENWYESHGIYGTEFHFLKIVDICNKEGGFDLKTVPVLFNGEEQTITQELLQSFNDAPADEGEGVVINVKCNPRAELTNLVWHYKSKSRDYLQRIK